MKNDDNYIAHINEETGAVQSVREHSENTALLCREFSIDPLKDFMYGTGILHDIGKFQPSFQDRIRGKNIRVDHSTCGAVAAGMIYGDPVSIMMEYCIAGHHSGIPDGGYKNDDGTSLAGRLKKKLEDFSVYREYIETEDIDKYKWGIFMTADCNNDSRLFIDKFSFFTRYAFSCLVDADSIDTARFCGMERVGYLNADFESALEQVNEKFSEFKPETELQKTRGYIQKQVFDNSRIDAGIYLLNMPTGSGKTLTSLKFALERVRLSQKQGAGMGAKKRIIYIAPFNSIIDQTATEFSDILGSSVQILRHQSTYSYENDDNISEDYREAAYSASENWEAPLIITTVVQFFESIYSNKRGKLRKLHNMADSLIIIDEAHLMPVDYLQPCLQAISFITRYLNSEAVFLTATMPDFGNLVRKYALPDSKIYDLVQDKTLFGIFKKCRYSYIGRASDEELLNRTADYPTSLIIVNTKTKARELYEKCNVKRKYHLSTYMTSYDRKKVIHDIKAELKKLDADYPDLKNVPEDRQICIFSTSLIEAGVDIDVFTVFRETSGLDSILQSGGRCNREGKRRLAEVYIFDSEKDICGIKEDITRGLLDKYEDISEEACIKEYYNRLYFMKEDKITQNSMHNFCTDIYSIPFKEYAERFKIIEDKNTSLVVVRDDLSEELVRNLQYSKRSDARKIQQYTCTLTKMELEDLVKQHAADDFGTGIYCLTNMDYYNKEVGIKFEASDYFI